eukprot:COSAG02_NODE_110_length_36062_cov_85.812106_35_plen_403_part_00
MTNVRSVHTHNAMVFSLQVLDQATDVLKTEGVLKGPSSKLEAARRHQQEMELLHAEELAAKNILNMQREREREEKAEKLRETAAAIDRKLAETLLSSDELPEETPDDGDDDAADDDDDDDDGDGDDDDDDDDDSSADAAPRLPKSLPPKSFLARFAAPRPKLQDSSHVPASHVDETGQHVGMTDGHHPHRAQKTLRERRHTDHVAALLEVAEGAAPPKLAILIRKMRPAAIRFLDLIDSLSVAVERTGFWLYVAQAREIWEQLPTTGAHALYGLALCFFGGIFANTLAACVLATGSFLNDCHPTASGWLADSSGQGCPLKLLGDSHDLSATDRYEAFQQTGWEKTKTCIHDLRKAADDLCTANFEDDLVDDDGDGVACVHWKAPVHAHRRCWMQMTRSPFSG